MDAKAETLGDRLTLARRTRFIGRAAELGHFERMLAGQAAPVWVLYGPGGMGKSTLLAELARRAEAAGRVTIEIDARHLTATPDSWRTALAAALEPGTGATEPPPGSVLLVDTFEAVAALDPWLRENELPRYPADVLVVLAGRTQAAAAWRLDPGWSSLAEASCLSPWSDAEARAYLTARLGTAEPVERLAQQGGGIPLIVALLADAWRRGYGPVRETTAAAFDPAFRETLVRDILDRFALDLKDAMLKRALDVLTVARRVTVPMLSETVDKVTAEQTYAWLAGLPFVQETEGGLQMHDLVRDAVAEAWRIRDPEAISRAALGVQRHLARRAPLVPRDDAIRYVKDWSFTLRYTDVAGVTDHRHAEDYGLGPIGDDGPAVIGMVKARLGAAMAARTADWIAHMPQGFHLVRDRSGQLRGVFQVIEMTALGPDALALDPAVARAWEHVRHRRAPKPGHSAACLRLTLDRVTDDLPNPTATLAGIWLTRRTLLDPAAEWNVAFNHNVEVMERVWPRLSRLNWAHRTPELDEEVEGQRHAAFVRDFVEDPVTDAWRPIPASPALPGPDAFADAVREALRQFGRAAVLADSPLLRCAFLHGTTAAPSGPAALRREIETAIGELSLHPADRKFFDALRLTWLDPGAKQEAVAAELGLPFNTFRYRLARGSERVAHILWQREVLARRG
jgi:hypothetical protein